MVEIQKQPRCLSVAERIRKMWYTHAVERVWTESQAEAGRPATWSLSQRKLWWVARQPGVTLDVTVRNDGRGGGGPVHTSSLDSKTREESWSVGSNAEERRHQMEGGRRKP